MHAEALKLRHTLAFWLCLLTPLMVALLGMAMLWSNPALLSRASADNRWSVVINTIMSMWAAMMLPLFVTLESALLAGLEHGNHQWKHLLALPLHRASHYVAKLIALSALVVFANIVLCLMIFAGGLLLTMADNASLAGLPPWEMLPERAVALFLTALPMIAAQLFIAIRWRSFSVAMTSGITATMLAMFIPHDGVFDRWFPWAMPSLAASSATAELPGLVAVGIIGFCLIALFGIQDFIRREYP